MEKIINKAKGMLAKHQKAVVITASVGAVMTMPTLAHAITAPANTDLAYDIYDVAVNKILNGPVGFVTAVAAIGWGATQVMKAWPIALMSILGGSAIINADTIVTSLGALI